jgi:cell division septation protein DedD
MALSRLLRIRKRTGARKRPDRKVRKSSGPKNGPLFLGVVASIILTVTLGILNIHFMHIEVELPKGQERVPSKNSLTNPFISTSESGDSSDEVCPVPPQVNFYKDLLARDDEKSWSAGAASGPNAGIDDGEHVSGAPNAPSGRNESHEQTASDKDDPAARQREALRRAGTQLPLPKAEGVPKRYTVQVGAFSNPMIAQQWSEKWRARGFKVMLKPVARPRAGVIYRLYLGDFLSKKRADALVRRLKAKEGISAMRLMVRN